MKLKDRDFAGKSIRFGMLSLWTTAFFLIFVRISFEYLDRQQEAVSAWLSTTLQRPIRLESVATTWNGWSPRIVANNFAILSTDLESDIVTFDQVTMDIDALSSIFSASINPSQVLVSGLDLKLKRDRNGAFSVAGMPPQKPSILLWIATQKKMFITDSRLCIVDDALATTY